MLKYQGRVAVDQIFRVITEQSQPTFDHNFNFISYYNWTGGPGALSPRVNNAGNGEPKAYTGLVGTHHRPSDDLTTFGGLLSCETTLGCILIVLKSVPYPGKCYVERGVESSGRRTG